MTGMIKKLLIILFNKYKDLIPYVIFGTLTTIINIAVYWIFSRIFMLAVMPSTIIAWVAGVVFAYLTNRKWVFKSDKYLLSEIIKEVISFFTCRLTTGFVDWLIMLVFVEKLGMNDVVLKFVSNAVVILVNYAASKLIIFRKDK